MRGARRGASALLLLLSAAAAGQGAAATGEGAPAVAAPLPSCAVADVPAPASGYGEWASTLLDTHFTLPPDYAPPDLVSTARAGLDESHRLRAVVIDDLAALVEAAGRAGHRLELQSAYRSYSYQQRTFQYWVDHDGYDYALRSSARPGHSEHQLGTVVDLRGAGGAAPWDVDDWAATPTGSWVAANAWRYGFVMSYPHGLEPQTCYVYEPWHYRYLGRAEARAVHDSGLTLRAYLWARVQGAQRAAH